MATNAGHGGAVKAAKKKRGPRGPQGTPGANGVNGTNGTNGANGTNGTAVAFAAVANDGTLVPNTVIPGGVFNLTQSEVAKEGTGLYCFKIPGVRSAVANVNNGNPGGGVSNGEATVSIGRDGGGAGCPVSQGYTAAIQTSTAAGADGDLSFFVWFQ